MTLEALRAALAVLELYQLRLEVERVILRRLCTRDWHKNPANRPRLTAYERAWRSRHRDQVRRLSLAAEWRRERAARAGERGDQVSARRSVYRDWRTLPNDERTDAEQAMAFVETWLRIPDGPYVGQPMRLEPFQEALFYQVIDTDVWQVVFSHRAQEFQDRDDGGATAVVCGGPARARRMTNSRVRRTRAIKPGTRTSTPSKMLQQNPELHGRYRLMPVGQNHRRHVEECHLPLDLLGSQKRARRQLPRDRGR